MISFSIGFYFNLNVQDPISFHLINKFNVGDKIWETKFVENSYFGYENLKNKELSILN